MATAETTTANTVATTTDTSATTASKAATTPSNSKPMNSASATPKTPARNNYAAPHTPIASAKRPRGSAARHSKHSQQNATAQYQNGASSPIVEKRGDTGVVSTPGGDGKENCSGNSPQSSSSESPMSPMHPPRPVTRDEEESDPPLPGDAAVNGSASPSSGSWVGRKVDALFSPVLSFLNGSDSKEGETEEQKDRELCASTHTRYDEDGDVDMTPLEDVENGERSVYSEQQIEAAILSKKEGDTTPAVETNDTSTTVSTSASSTPTNRTPVVLSASSTEATEVEVANTNGVSNQGSNAEATQEQYPSPNNTLSSDDEDAQETALQQQYNYTNSHEEEYLEEDEEEIDEDDEDEDDDEEFNPYLFIKTLPSYSQVVPNPHHRICLPPKNPSSPPIALVLDLDETLVHCTVEPTHDADMVFPVVFNGIQYQVHVRTRPYLKEFLEAVVDKFEVIVFTASQRVYADELLDRIDPEGKYIKHRMFREACLPVEGNYLKDLNVLGRDLRKAVLVDNSPHAFGYQVDNGIPIESWFDDPNDTELLKLERFLRTLHGADDVRDLVRARFQTHRLVADA